MDDQRLRDLRKANGHLPLESILRLAYVADAEEKWRNATGRAMPLQALRQVIAIYAAAERDVRR